MVLFRNKSIGFTLIELMVVISILAILVAIGVTSYSTIRKNSRDSIRKSDLHSIQNALEQYYGKNESYPTDLQTLVDQSYLPKGEPLDPKNTTCTYDKTLATSSYTICADLESKDNTYFCSCTNDGTGNVYTCPIEISSPTYEECVTNLQ